MAVQQCEICGIFIDLDIEDIEEHELGHEEEEL